MEEKVGRRERKKLLSRKAILDAAVREFSRKGFKETSVADIMNAADLGIGTFYNYFESKEEILMCLLGRLVHEVDEALKDMRAAKRPSYELLDAAASQRASSTRTASCCRSFSRPPSIRPSHRLKRTTRCPRAW